MVLVSFVIIKSIGISDYIEYVLLFAGVLFIGYLYEYIKGKIKSKKRRPPS